MINDKDIGVMIGHALNLAHAEQVNSKNFIGVSDSLLVARAKEILELNVNLQKEIRDSIKHELRPIRKPRIEE